MQCSTYIHISSICRFFFISEVYSLYVAMFHNNNNKKKKWNKLKWAFNTSYLHLCLNQNLTRQNTQSMNCPTLLPWKKKEKIESKVGFTPGIFLKIEKSLVLDVCIFKISICFVTNGHAAIALFCLICKVEVIYMIYYDLKKRSRLF